VLSPVRWFRHREVSHSRSQDVSVPPYPIEFAFDLADLGPPLYRRGTIGLISRLSDSDLPDRVIFARLPGDRATHAVHRKPATPATASAVNSLADFRQLQLGFADMNTPIWHHHAEVGVRQTGSTSPKSNSDPVRTSVSHTASDPRSQVQEHLHNATAATDPTL
jgi:hypothetical protein